MRPDTFLVVAWHSQKQAEQFLDAWGLGHGGQRFLVMQHDEHKEGCAVTKNRGVSEAVRRGARTVVVLDDDCYPSHEARSVEELCTLHEAALEPQEVRLFTQVTTPASRGTPYFNRTAPMPVAASMGYWLGVGDFDAPSQLVHGARHRMDFRRTPVYGRFFALSGMNLAFRPLDWDPWCTFVDVPRFDDIWMGYLWQKEAMRRGACFNLAGPVVTHSRQSNVWQNLKDEARWLQESDDLWRKVWQAPPDASYQDLCRLLPAGGRPRP